MLDYILTRYTFFHKITRSAMNLARTFLVIPSTDRSCHPSLSLRSLSNSIPPQREKRKRKEDKSRGVVLVKAMAVEIHCCGARFFLQIVAIVLLVLFAGLMSGLTLGLMSLSLVDLEVLSKSGTPQDRKHAGNLPFLPGFFFSAHVKDRKSVV